MPRANALRTGDVEEEVIQRRVIPAEETQNAAGYGMDAYDYMAGLSPDEWNEHIVYLYRKFPLPANGAKRTYIAKLTHAFDDQWLKENFGGGQYHFILKKGSQRIKEGDSDDIPGPVKDPDQTTAFAGGARNGDTELVRTVELVLNKMGMSPNNGSGELSHKAFINALEIQKAAIISNQMTPQQMLELADKMRGANHASSEQPEWMKQLLAAAVPAVVGLVVKMLEPKDALATLKGLGEAFTVMRSVNPTSETAAPDMGVTLLQQGPSLLRGVADLLGELRRAEEIKAARAAAAPPAPVALPSGPRSAIPPDRRPPPDPASLPRPTQAEMKNGEPDPEWVWGHVIRMCENGDDGVFAYNFLDQIDAASMKSLRDAKITLEQLKQMIEGGAIHPVLVRIAALPGYQKFIAEFHAALMAPEVPAPAAA